MRYLGGKFKIRKQVAPFLESLRNGRDYFEPFVGGGWILQEISGKRTASDGNRALISMYRALQNGWQPPSVLTEEEYKHYQKNKPMDDPMTAFCGFGCSFAGKWFGGYARDERCPDYANKVRLSLLKQYPLIKDVTFVDGLFQEHHPENMLVYADPPYTNTTTYGAFNSFDHELFWQMMREWSKNNTVVISEYAAPDDFICVKELSSRMGMTVSDGSRPHRTEKLFMYGTQKEAEKTYIQMEFSLS